MYQISFTIDRKVYQITMRNVSMRDVLRFVHLKLARLDGLVIVEVNHE